MRLADRHCTFCDLIHGAGEASICYEDAEAVAFMDIQPVNAGHVLVVPRRHVTSFFELTASEVQAVHELLCRLKVRLQGSSDPAGWNIGVNIGAAAGQTVPHVHVHIVPRRSGDGGGSVHSIFRPRPSRPIADVAREIRKLAGS